MALSITTKPAYPVPGRVRVNFTPSASVNYVRVWCTAAPEGSDYRASLERFGTVASDARVVVFEGYTKEEWQPFLTVGGRYSFEAQEYTRDTDEGAYRFDPRGAPTETKVGAEQSVDIYVGEQVTQKLTTQDLGDSIEFTYFVFNDTVRETTLNIHGINSPSYINPTSERMRLAAQATAVQSAAGAMVDQTTTTVFGDIAALIEEIRVDLSAHMEDLTYHSAVDTENRDGVRKISRSSIVSPVRKFMSHFDNHIRNTPNEVHEDGSAVVNSDANSALFATIPTSVADAVAALADIIRATDRHYASAVPHKATTDSRATTTTLGLIVATHNAFWDALEITAGVPPVGQPGAFVAARYGYDVNPTFGPQGGTNAGLSS